MDMNRYTIDTICSHTWHMYAIHYMIRTDIHCAVAKPQGGYNVTAAAPAYMFTRHELAQKSVGGLRKKHKEEFKSHHHSCMNSMSTYIYNYTRKKKTALLKGWKAAQNMDFEQFLHSYAALWSLQTWCDYINGSETY